MSIPSSTRDGIIARALAYFRTAFEGTPLGIKKFLGRSARAIGSVIWGLNKAIEDLDADVVPTAQMSYDLLSDWAFLIGLPDGTGLGNYGVLKPTTSSGGVGQVTGIGGTVFANGLTLTAEDGSTQVELSGSVTIPGTAPASGTVTGLFSAITTGTAGNLPVGTVLTWDGGGPAGADPSVKLTSPLVDAVDTESAPSVYNRLKTRMQNPPRGGTSEDIKTWAESVPSINEVYVYPRRSGTGTVDAVITINGSGIYRVPSITQLDLVQNAIDLARPVASEQITALQPQVNSGHSVVIKVVPSKTAYDFDWSGAGLTVFLIPSSLSIQLNTLAPASLKAAIDAFNGGTGAPPRLQIISTGRVVNDPVSATAWIDGGGKTTITFATPVSSWTAPTIGDAVYPYGPVVKEIAEGILALADSLGPSRSSGFADDLIVWDDTLSISGISAIAEVALDSDGSKFVQRVPVGDVLIDGVAADIVPNDDGINAPELLYLTSVAVIEAP